MTDPPLHADRLADPPARAGSRRPWIVGLIVAAWISAVLGATVAFLGFEFTAGGSTAAPAAWPAQSQLVRATDRPTLLLFAHPQCACTHASLDELAVILGNIADKASAYVVFVQLPGFSNAQLHDESWDKAGRIPGLTRLVDSGGVEAQRFHALTSGYTVVYGADGSLLFDGGITGSRGQVGVNAGRLSVASLLRGDAPNVRHTRTFGCSIFDPHPDPAAAGHSDHG